MIELQYRPVERGLAENILIAFDGLAGVLADSRQRRRQIPPRQGVNQALMLANQVGHLGEEQV